MTGTTKLSNRTAVWQGQDNDHHLHPFTPHPELRARGIRMITHADVNNDSRAAFVVGKLLGYDSASTLSPRKVQTENLDWGQHRISFDYISEEPVEALLSLTYFPGWTAYVDGESVDMYRHERLTLLELTKLKSDLY